MNTTTPRKKEWRILASSKNTSISQVKICNLLDLTKTEEIIITLLNLGYTDIRIIEAELDSDES